MDTTPLPGPGSAAELRVLLTTFHAPGGVRNEAARDIGVVVRRSPKRYPPAILTPPGPGHQALSLIYTAHARDLPDFHDLFEQYVDKNGFIAETFVRLRPHWQIPYILFLSERGFFLYDFEQEELVRWGDSENAIEDLLLGPLARGEDLRAHWAALPRKTNLQRAEEFGRWLDLWKAAIGSRTNAVPQFMHSLTQKVLLIFLFEQWYGLGEIDLNLRRTFLEQRKRAKRKGDEASETDAPFDGIAWFHEAANRMREILELESLSWNDDERPFFALLGDEIRRQFSQFLLELFLLSRSKFAAAVQTDVFCDPEDRLRLWKYAVTETLDIPRRLPADDVNVYQPIVVDIDEAGAAWALYVAERILIYWRERCQQLQQLLRERKTLRLQFDMFQQADVNEVRLPRMEDVFDLTFRNSLRVRYQFPSDRETAEFLMVLKALELSREWNLPQRPLRALEETFERKARTARAEAG